MCVIKPVHEWLSLSRESEWVDNERRVECVGEWETIVGCEHCAYMLEIRCYKVHTGMQVSKRISLRFDYFRDNTQKARKSFVLNLEEHELLHIGNPEQSSLRRKYLAQFCSLIFCADTHALPSDLIAYLMEFMIVYHANQNSIIPGCCFLFAFYPGIGII